ncbi:MAG: amidohydrolase [Proteobacteria bacterium]|nr:amidohydrolase [Pseudomonadota bacterium]
MTRVRLLQTELTWEDPAANRARFSGWLAEGGENCLQVLPEMFSTGFSMASERLAEPMDGETVGWMQNQADRLQSPLCGSVIIQDGGYYNRFLYCEPGRPPVTYDKRHLFRMADEHTHYAPGDRCPVFEFDGLRFKPQVCYDLRFPVYARNRGDYDVLIYVANWPATRREHWITLLRARAIENLCYVVAVNRVGTDGNGISYSGDSCVVDFRGETLLDLGNREAAADIRLDKAALEEYREAFPAWQDADDFRLLPP